MSRKVFRDAVHDMISLHRELDHPATEPSEWGDALLLELIDTPELQRLRRIRQLGPASRVYPSAEHSRFSHAVGTMHLAKRILSTLPVCDQPLMDQETLLAVKVAALFHDVGHGPYSHVFEHLMPGIESHEVWGWRILSHQGPARRAIKKHCLRLQIDFDGFYEKLHTVWGHNSSQEGERTLGSQVISSQLDADRMDYLLRDAYFTGVSYGHYDLEWLLHSLRIQKVEGTPRLCVDLTKGPVALESYVTSRDHMYRQVYDHKTVRAFEALLIHIFQLLVWIFQEEGGWPPGMSPPLLRFLNDLHHGRQPQLADYLALDDTVLDYCFGQWADATPQTPGQGELRWKCRLFRDRSPVYRRIFWRIPDMGGLGEQLAFGFQQTRSEKGVVSKLTPGPVEKRSCSTVIHDPTIAEAIDLFFRKRANDPIQVTDPDGTTRKVPLGLLVYVDRLDRSPYAHLQYTPGRSDPVYVVSGDQKVLPAEQVSGLINFLGKSHRRQARVFVDPRAESSILALVQQELKQWV
ncbi:MAG: HD domain-containing protein [Magnetococcales bacterium]|nr:HD domain-containing protein [Magnetococcales bacterium]